MIVKMLSKQELCLRCISFLILFVSISRSYSNVSRNLPNTNSSSPSEPNKFDANIFGENNNTEKSVISETFK